jgi:hypothetical protein
MAGERFAFVVAVVGDRDVMPRDALERLLERLVNRHQDTRNIILLSPGRSGPELRWCQGRGWTLVVEPENRNRVKQDCGIVAQAAAAGTPGAG